MNSDSAEQEERLCNALEKYRHKFGYKSFPGIDYLPYEWRDDECLIKLLTDCVNNGKSIGKTIKLIRYPPNVLI